MVAGIMEQARKLQDLVGLFPAAKTGTTIRRVLFMIKTAEYLTEQNAALVDIYYGSPPGIDFEFLTFADYWADVMGVLQSAPRLGEKAKTVFGFEHSLHTYYHLKMNELEQMQYKGLYDRLVKDLQTLRSTILAEARALEQSGRLDYTITLSIFPRGTVSQSPREQHNFQVLEDKLFLDPEQLIRLKKFMWSSAATKLEQYTVQLTGIKYHLPHVSFT
jgi:hypothetical protein